MRDPGVLIVNRSLLRTSLHTLGSLGFTMLGAAIAFRWIPVPYGSLAHFAGWVALLFFGACTPLWAQGLLETRPVLEISPDGMLDRRASLQKIPWKDIQLIKVFEMRGSKGLTFRLVPGARERLPQTRVRRLIDSANARLGFGDLFLSAAGLDTEFEQVAEAILRNWAQAHRRTSNDPEIEKLRQAIYS